MEENMQSKIQHMMNIASPVASGLSLLHPAFLAIPIISSVVNELFSFFDKRSTDRRLIQLQEEIEKEGIKIPDFEVKVSQLNEHGQYVVRNSVKHLCLAAQPETVDAIIRAIIDLIMNEPYGLPEHICEILQQCNADDIILLQRIKWFQEHGDKSTYLKERTETAKDLQSSGMHDRSILYGEDTTIFWNDFVKVLGTFDSVVDVGRLLNSSFVKRSNDGSEVEEIIDFAYVARAIIKMQNLGVLHCDYVSTMGTTSALHIDRFHITFFGMKLLEYIDYDADTEQRI